MRSSLLLLVGAVSLAACGESPTITGPRSPALGTPAFDAAGGAASGAVFTQTNAAAGNAVVAFARAGDGSLTYTGTFSTGGNGIGGPGMTATASNGLGGVGLANTRARLEQLYGSDHQFECRNESTGGFTVLVSVPWRPA